MQKKIIFSILAIGMILGLLNLVASWVIPKASVSWDNPLMNGRYSVRSFPLVPDEQRWYRLDPEPQIPASGELILNFGDSSTWGWGLTDRSLAYPGQLENSVNLGVPGYTSLQGRRYVEELVPKYHKRIKAVTLYFGNNDSTENGQPDAKKVQSRSSLLSRVALYRVLRDILQPLRPHRNQRPRVNPDEYQGNMQAMIDLVNSYGIPVVVIVPPVPGTWPPGHLTFLKSLEPRVQNPWVKAELQEAKRLYQQGRYQEAREHDWVVPRIKASWKERLYQLQGSRLVVIPEYWEGAEYPYLFEDYCHPSVRLHSQIAEKIQQALE